MKDIKMISKEQSQVNEVKPVVLNKSYELVKIPTQHEIAIQTPEGEILELSTGEVLVEILNILREMKRGMLG